MISRGGLHNAGCYSDYTSRLRGRETVAGGRRWRSTARVGLPYGLCNPYGFNLKPVPYGQSIQWMTCAARRRARG